MLYVYFNCFYVNIYLNMTDLCKCKLSSERERTNVNYFRWFSFLNMFFSSV